MKEIQIPAAQVLRELLDQRVREVDVLRRLLRVAAHAEKSLPDGVVHLAQPLAEVLQARLTGGE